MRRAQTPLRALARTWGARGEVALAPPAVPRWTSVPAGGERPFTVGYAGRLVKSKGVMDLLAAVRMLDAPVELLLIGNGELRAALEGKPIPGSHVRVLDGLAHGQMAEGYAQIDVLVLPSHTTRTWKEQFGRVIVEALWCGVPVVGSDSGEIPWLIELTGGGLVFPEGDRGALAARSRRLRAEPQLAPRARRRPVARRSRGCSRCRRPQMHSSACSRALSSPARANGPTPRGHALAYRRWCCLATISLPAEGERGSGARRCPRRRAAPGRQPAAEALGDRCGSRADQKAVLAVRDQLAHAAHRRRQHRQAARRRLEGDQREGLVRGGQHERVRQLVDQLNVGGDAEPVHRPPDPERVGQLR